jgi:septal ring factor EnvC (AmiA/AmiB activator)
LPRKKQLVFDSSGKLDSEKRRAAELAERAKTLKQLIADLAAARLRQEAIKTKEALALEAERKRQEEFLLRPSVAFSSTQGHLEYPVQGQNPQAFRPG